MSNLLQILHCSLQSTTTLSTVWFTVEKYSTRQQLPGEDPFDDNPDNSTNVNAPEVFMAIQGGFLGSIYESREEAAGSAFHGVDSSSHFRTHYCK